jgi:hypothetical protein
MWRPAQQRPLRSPTIRVGRHITECATEDPPYYVKGGDLYQHGFTVADHERLAVALKETKHAWVLSYDDCFEVRRLYDWACVEPLEVSYSITATKDKETGHRLSRTKSELLICPKRTKGVKCVVDDYILARTG